MTTYAYHATPIGSLLIAVKDNAICAVEFPESQHPIKRDAHWREGTHGLLDQAREQLDGYFAGTRKQFDLPLAPQGTEFQRSVWQALRQIPFGQIRSYAEQARAIGKPNAVRAVGAANGRNPIPIFIPCHRVIGSNRSLTGFAGGLPTKQFLLRLEGVEI